MAKYGINQVSLIGKVGAPPQLSYTKNQEAITRIWLAITEKRRNKQGVVEDQTEWVAVVFYKNKALTIAQHIKKGATIFIEGRLRSFNQTHEEQGKVMRAVVEGRKILLLDSTIKPVGDEKTSAPLMNPDLLNQLGPLKEVDDNPF